MFNPFEIGELISGLKDISLDTFIEGYEELSEIYKNREEIFSGLSEYDKSYYAAYIETTLAFAIVPAKIDRVNAVKSNSKSETHTKLVTLLRAWKAKQISILYNWGNPDTFWDHFDRHGSDFGDIDEFEYGKIANDFYLNNSQKILQKVDSNGIIRKYDPITNTFGSYNSNGTTKTLYKPNPNEHGFDSNLEYWNAQPGE